MARGLIWYLGKRENGIGVELSGVWQTKTMGSSGMFKRGDWRETSSKSSMWVTKDVSWLYNVRRDAGLLISGGNLPRRWSMIEVKISREGHVFCGMKSARQ